MPFSRLGEGRSGAFVPGCPGPGACRLCSRRGAGVAAARGWRLSRVRFCGDAAGGVPGLPFLWLVEVRLKEVDSAGPWRAGCGGVGMEKRKGAHWGPEHDRALVELVRARPGVPLRNVFREFADRLGGGITWQGVKSRWYAHVKPGLDGLGGANGGGGVPPAAGMPGSSGGGRAPDIRSVLLELARAPGRDGRLTARDLELVAERFRVPYATVLALWGQMWAAGEVVYPTRGELLAELVAARERIAALEAELASVRAELQEAREAKKRLESLMEDLRRLVA